MYRFILVALVLATPANAGPAHTSAAPIPVILPHTPPPASKPVIAPVLPVTPTVVPTVLPAKPAVLPTGTSLPRKEVAPAKPAIPNTVIPHSVKTTQVTGLPLTIVQPTKVKLHVQSYDGTTVLIGTETAAGTIPLTGSINLVTSGKTITSAISLPGEPTLTIVSPISGNKFSGTVEYTYAGGAKLDETITGTIKGGTISGTVDAFASGGGFGSFTGTFVDRK